MNFLLQYESNLRFSSSENPCEVSSISRKYFDTIWQRRANDDEADSGVLHKHTLTIRADILPPIVRLYRPGSQ